MANDIDISRLSLHGAELPAPVIPAALDGGLGYDDIQRDPLGFLLVQCGPWNELERGDTVEIYWGVNEANVASYAVTESGNYIITIPVPVRAIHTEGEGLVAVYYIITTGFGGKEVRSNTLDVRVKFNPPGGIDPSPDTPYVNENLAAPVVSPDPVPDNAQIAKVTVAPWQNMAENDLLTLNWGGIPVTLAPLSAGEVNQEVTVTVTREVLELAGGGRLPVTYSVRDEVNNWSLYAPYAWPDVQIEDPSALEAPLLKEADPDNGVLDVTGLTEEDTLTVQVPRYQGITTGDRVMVNWAGRTAGGQDVNWKSTEYTVPSPIPFVLEFAVPATQAITLAQGSLAITYAVVNKSQVSRALRLQVTGEVQRLQPPAVAEARGGVLDPADTAAGATVIVAPYAGMAVGDTVAYVWAGTRADGTPTFYTDTRNISGNGVGKEVRFLVPAAEVTALNNGRLTLYYTVETFSVSDATRSIAPQATLRSPDLILTVKEAGTQPNLPAPTVDGEKDGYLPPDLADTRVRIPAWPNIAKGDRLDLSWAGKTSFTDFLLVNITGEQVFYVEKAYIEGNRDNRVQVSYKATPANGEPQNSDIREFQVKDPSADLPTPVVPEAIGNNLDGNLTSARLRVSAEAGLQLGDRVTGSFNGMTLGPEQVTTPGQALDLKITQAMIAAAAGKSIGVYYEVERNGEQLTSPVLTLHVGQLELIAPVIVAVKDDKGNPILNGGSTGAKTIILSGTAAKEQNVELWDNGFSKGVTVVGASGQWTKTVSDLTVKAHSYTMKALYGSNPVSSPWNVTVTRVRLEDFKLSPLNYNLARGTHKSQNEVTIENGPRFSKANAYVNPNGNGGATFTYVLKQRTGSSSGAGFILQFPELVRTVTLTVTCNSFIEGGSIAFGFYTDGDSETIDIPSGSYTRTFTNHASNPNPLATSIHIYAQQYLNVQQDHTVDVRLESVSWTV